MRSDLRDKVLVTKLPWLPLLRLIASAESYRYCARACDLVTDLGLRVRTNYWYSRMITIRIYVSFDIFKKAII